MKITDGRGANHNAQLLWYENYRRGVRHNDRGANHNAQLLWYAPGGLIPMIKLL